MPKEALIALFVIIIIIAVILFSILPKLLILKENIKNIQLEIDDILRNRWNLVFKFVEAVKRYSGKNLSILQEIILLRNTTFENMEFEKKIKTDIEIDRRISKLYMDICEVEDVSKDEKINNVAENYEKLGEKLIDFKNEYNNQVDKLNRFMMCFPSNIVAFLAGIKKIEKL